VQAAARVERSWQRCGGAVREAGRGLAAALCGRRHARSGPGSGAVAW
jgi:hypothetical protein